MDEIRDMTEAALPVDRLRLLDFDATLRKYKAGKARLESRVVAAESWWKLRNTAEEEKEAAVGAQEGFRAKSGWLHNVITSKHADAMENYPEPIILPREPGDREQARTLSAVLPCILEQNAFETTYSDVMWQKLKTGTGVYKIGWDTDKVNGLGDIAIERVNLLHVFWEPGIEDIQQSPYFFHCEYYGNEQLISAYPELADKLRGNKQVLTQFRLDDAVDLTDKSLVIDVYYKRPDRMGGMVLHYCKYVGDTVLYATENDAGGRGLYDHGQYPFVFDALWPIEGSPCGYGYVDLCKNPQTQIDLMDSAFTQNALVGATPRYFSRTDSAINEQELLDLRKPIVHVASGTLDETFLREIDSKPLGTGYLSVYDRKIEELRHTSGNTEAATGSTPSGVTAASAIAALQEASGKTSRDMTQGSYRAFREIVELCIELVRQFYTLPRVFRITGEMGQTDFAAISNAGMQPQPIYYGDVSLGMVAPVFDVKIKAQKRSAYSRMSQNELAMQLYGAGFFEPTRADQALLCLDMMEFEGKDELMGKISRNATLAQALLMALDMLSQSAPDAAAQIAASVGLGAPAAPVQQAAGQTAQTGGESGVTARARERTAQTTEAAR